MGFVEINQNTYTLQDGNVRFYLLIGDREALLVDSGMQISNAKELAMEITDKPIKLFNTHADRDHIGSNHEFEEIMINPAELVNYTGILSTKKIIGIYDGDIIDIGNRPLKAIALPGHTPGSTGLLDLGSGIFFSGDPIVKGDNLFLFGRMRNIVAYINSLEHLLSLNESITSIYPCHGQYPLKMEIVTELIESAKQIIQGHYNYELTEIFGQKVAKYNTGVCSFLCDIPSAEEKYV